MQPRGHLRGEARGQREPQPHLPLPGAASAPSAAGAGLTLWQLHLHKRAETTRLGKKGPGSSRLVPPCSACRATVLPCRRHRQRCPFPERRRPLPGTPLGKFRQLLSILISNRVTPRSKVLTTRHRHENASVLPQGLPIIANTSGRTHSGARGKKRGQEGLLGGQWHQ